MKKRFSIVITLLLLSLVGARADYDPQNPPDPSATYLLTVSVSPTEAGYASGGGSYKKGQIISLNTSANDSYVFQYWTCNGVRINDASSFSYTMPDQTVSMVAVYSYDPTIPDEPSSSQRYHLYLDTNMPGSCTFNLTSGAKQKAGEYITVSAQNISVGYKFQGWFKGDQKVSGDDEFSYKMPASDVTLIAKFVYDPDNPSAPGAAPLVKAISYSRQYGEPNPQFSYSARRVDLNGTPTLTCSATELSPVGVYDIIISKGSVTNNNISYVNGTLTITKAPLVIKAGDYTKLQGEDNPTFTATYEGFKNNETDDVLTTKPTISCEATKNSTVGEYTVTISGAEATNYDISYVNGKLTVSEAQVEKKVDNPTITLSQTSYTYDGNAKEPTVTVKDGEITIPTSEYTVSYSDNINVGTATVTITDVEGGNYAVSGSTTFTISAAEGCLTAPTGKSSLVYNGTAQELINAGSTTTGTIEYSLDGTTYATTIPQGTDAGSYTVYYKVTGDANHNDIAAQHLGVTIAKAPLTVSAGYYEIFEGEDIPSFESKYDGFVNNETADVLTTKPTISCEATKSSRPDEYKVTVSGAEAKNYEITYVDGKLTIIAMTFVSGGDDSREEDAPATYQITSKGDDGVTTPTVAITDDKDVSGAFAIPETVTYHNKTFKVTEIGESTFENNKHLTEVTIPSSITNIGDKAFKGCSNLKSITVYVTTPISLAVAGTRGVMTRADGSSVFDGVDKATCILYVPEGSVELYKAAPVWSEFQNILAISSTGINGIIKNGEPQDIYDLQGHKVKAKATSLEGLPRGIYIINGKKTTLKQE